MSLSGIRIVAVRGLSRVEAVGSIPLSRSSNRFSGRLGPKAHRLFEWARGVGWPLGASARFEKALASYENFLSIRLRPIRKTEGWCYFKAIIINVLNRIACGPGIAS